MMLDREIEFRIRHSSRGAKPFIHGIKGLWCVCVGGYPQITEMDWHDAVQFAVAVANTQRMMADRRAAKWSACGPAKC